MQLETDLFLPKTDAGPPTAAATGAAAAGCCGEGMVIPAAAAAAAGDLTPVMPTSANRAKSLS